MRIALIDVDGHNFPNLPNVAVKPLALAMGI